MEINDVKRTLINVINSKYNELNLDKKNNGIFGKIRYFEGNAIGQIGETFIKSIYNDLGISLDDDRKVVHDEYDILLNKKKIEIKTATAKNGIKCFQFNGINPDYNHDYIILIGLTIEKIYYYFINKKDIFYDHKNRGKYVKINKDKNKKLVEMNPNNTVNLKLTMNINEMNELDNIFINTLLKISGKKSK